MKAACLSDRIELVFKYAPLPECSACLAKRSKDCHVKLATLCADVAYEVDGRRLTVQRGFCWDSASIPQAVWTLIGSPFDRDFIRGALLHDAAYASHCLTRAEADRALFKLIRADGCSIVTANAVYQAVHKMAKKYYDRGDEVLKHWQKYVVWQ
jgi:hypothetical protein